MTSTWPVRMALLALIWGFSFLFIKIADPVVGPLWVAQFRILFGLLALAAVLAVRRVPLPARGPVWGHLAVSAVLFNVAPFTLFALGEVRVSSLLAGILNATTPLFTLLASLLIVRGQRLSRLRLVGLALGLAGVVLVLGPWRGIGHGDLTGALLCLAAAVSYGLAFAYMRRFLSATGLGPLQLSAGQLLCAAVETGLVAAVTRTPPAGMTAGALAAVVALGAAGTGLAYVLNFSIIRDAGPTTASTVTYLSPVVSTLAGVLLLGDPLGWWQPVGTVVILVGAALAQGQLAAPSAARAAAGRRRQLASSSSWNPRNPS